MSTHNICFYGEITKMIPKLSSNTLPICFTAAVPWSKHTEHLKNRDFLKVTLQNEKISLYLGTMPHFMNCISINRAILPVSKFTYDNVQKAKSFIQRLCVL